MSSRYKAKNESAIWSKGVGSTSKLRPHDQVPKPEYAPKPEYLLWIAFSRDVFGSSLQQKDHNMNKGWKLDQAGKFFTLILTGLNWH